MDSRRMIRLWIDDVRPAPQGWYWAHTSTEAILFFQNKLIDEVSFDHDSGDGDDFIRVALWLEEMACFNQYHRVKWNIHSANPVGREALRMALESADRYWNKHLIHSQQ
jgi:hypothetical protein